MKHENNLKMTRKKKPLNHFVAFGFGVCVFLLILVRVCFVRISVYKAGDDWSIVIQITRRIRF